MEVDLYDLENSRRLSLEILSCKTRVYTSRQVQVFDGASKLRRKCLCKCACFPCFKRFASIQLGCQCRSKVIIIASRHVKVVSLAVEHGLLHAALVLAAAARPLHRKVTIIADVVPRVALACLVLPLMERVL